MKVVLGFDGGGTKTQCVAMDLSGAVVGRGRGSASNPTRIGFEPAAAGVKQAADSALAAVPQPAEILAICAGLAGTASPENHERMRQLLQGEFPGITVDLRTDLDLPLAAMPGGPAIVLIVGTGSAAVGRDAAGRQLREGGHGPAGSDEGSAFDIGRAASAAARSESTAEESALSRQILRHLGYGSWIQLDAKAAANPDEVYPRIFPVVAASADSGNSLAQSLLESAAGKLAAMVQRLAQWLGIAEQTFPLAKTGGTMGRSPFFDQALERELRERLPDAVISAVPAEPAETAARIALRAFLSSQEIPQ